MFLTLGGAGMEKKNVFVVGGSSGIGLEIARLTVHLLSDGGSWITGQIFHIDGGMSSIRVFK